MARAKTAHWEFARRFRRGAFGWKSQPAIQRVKQAVREIKTVARRDPVLAAEGAVLFLERVSPALEHVDSSSGAIGTAVNHAIEELVAVVAGAPVDARTRGGWLDRLWEAHAADVIPYIERLGDFWGELCVSPEIASAWADQLSPIVAMALSPDPEQRGYFHGTTACLSALLRAGCREELLALLPPGPPSAGRILGQTFYAHALASRGDLGRSVSVLKATLAMEPEVNDPIARFWCGLMELQYLAFTGDPTAAAVGRAKLAQQRQSPTLLGDALLAWWVGEAHLCLGELNEAERMFQIAIDVTTVELVRAYVTDSRESRTAIDRGLLSTASAK